VGVVLSSAGGQSLLLMTSEGSGGEVVLASVIFGVKVVRELVY